MADAPAGNLVALRDRREEVIALLTEGFTQDLLDVDELDTRLDRAHTAMTVADLDALVADLDPPKGDGAAGSATALAVRPDRSIVRDDPNRPATTKMWCIMSGVDKKGRWVVPREMRVRCFMGGGRLDFREADFGPGVTELHVSAFMGGFQIIVPPELAVDVDASAIMGGFDERHRAPVAPAPDQAILRITGWVVMGGVEVATMLPGETDRDARRRSKRERRDQRRLARAQRRALPPGRDD
jgi:DUF1707 SHOCT-like domain